MQRSPSSISPDAGDGVFATKDIGAGEAVTFFPGRVSVPPPYITLPEGGPAALPLPSDLAQCIDVSHGIRRDDMILLCAGNRIDGSYFEERRDADSATPAALGHVINHPPAGTMPNVAAWPVRIELAPAVAVDGVAASRQAAASSSGGGAGLDGAARARLAVLSVPSPSPAEALLRSIFEMDPRGWYADAVSGSVVPHPPDALAGAVMVAIADLRRGEELFFDYALQPDSRGELPAWFSPVDWRW